jgi:hypothetical protein
MIDKETARKQAKRFSGLEFFPQTAEALAELISALQVADTEEIAKSFTDDWIGGETSCPKPSQVRIGIYDRNELVRVNRKKCPSCGGSGVVTTWFLVTYRGNSFLRETSAEIENCKTAEQARDFAQLIADSPGSKDQTVLSAAKPCECRRVAA